MTQTNTDDNLNNFNRAISSVNLYDNNNQIYGLLDAGFKNYKEDINYIVQVNNKIKQLNNNKDISNNLLQIEKINKRHIETNTYYINKYYKQIGILKEIIFFCCLGLLGFILYSKSIFSENLLIMYIGFLLSILFIKVMYDLWDIYIRDEKNFNEYDFSVYGDGKTGLTNNSNLFDLLSGFFKNSSNIKINNCPTV